jgi:hypothetical protein
MACSPLVSLTVFPNQRAAVIYNALSGLDGSTTLVNTRKKRRQFLRMSRGAGDDGVRM